MSEATFVDSLKMGLKLDDELLIDAHAHMGPWFNFHIPGNGTPESMIKAMDMVGIDMTVVAPHVAIGPDMHEGNRQAVEAAQRYPNRFVAYVTINPRYSIADIEAEIEWCEDQLGEIRGFKLHPSCHGVDCSHRGYGAVYEYANDHAIPILSHVWSGPEEEGTTFLTRQAQAYPRITFIHAHSANQWERMRDLLDEVKRNDNVVLDLCGSKLFYGMLEEMVDEIGAGRIVWGTDSPFIDVRPSLGRIMAARIDDDDKRLILGKNAQRIFGL